MAEVDEKARENGVRFRHYYSNSNKHIATIATRISEYGEGVIDIGVSLCSTLDESDKIKAKTIALGRVLQGSKKFMTSMHIDVLRSRIKDYSVLDVFIPVMHPAFKNFYVKDGKVLLKGRIESPLWEEDMIDYCNCEDCAGCGY